MALSTQKPPWTSGDEDQKVLMDAPCNRRHYAPVFFARLEEVVRVSGADGERIKDAAVGFEIGKVRRS